VEKIFDGWGPSPIDRPDGAMAGLPPLDLPLILHYIQAWRFRRHCGKYFQQQTIPAA